MNKKGVTLIELIVVMVIIAIGAALIAPNIGAWLPNYRLRSATRDLVSTMRTAQMKAVSTNTAYSVVFVGANSYQVVPGGILNNLPNGVEFENNTFPGATVQFNTDSTSSGGGVTLKNVKQKKRITITSVTGRIKID